MAAEGPWYVAWIPFGYGGRFSVSLLRPLGRWQTLVKCPNSCAGGTQSLLVSLGGSLPVGWKVAVQRLWCSIMRLLASWGFGTRIVEKPAPVASEFDWILSPYSDGFRFTARHGWCASGWTGVRGPLAPTSWLGVCRRSAVVQAVARLASQRWEVLPAG